MQQENIIVKEWMLHIENIHRLLFSFRKVRRRPSSIRSVCIERIQSSNVIVLWSVIWYRLGRLLVTLCCWCLGHYLQKRRWMCPWCTKKPVANFDETSKTLAMQTISGFLVRSFITREISGNWHDPWLRGLNLIILLNAYLVASTITPLWTTYFTLLKCWWYRESA